MLHYFSTTGYVWGFVPNGEIWNVLLMFDTRINAESKKKTFETCVLKYKRHVLLAIASILRIHFFHCVFIFTYFADGTKP